MVLATNWLEFGGIAAGAAAVATTALAALTGWLAWSARELAAALSVQGEMTSKRVRAMNGTALPVLRQREGSGNAEVVMRWELSQAAEPEGSFTVRLTYHDVAERWHETVIQIAKRVPDDGLEQRRIMVAHPAVLDQRGADQRPS
jgi:hypothetical protein